MEGTKTSDALTQRKCVPCATGDTPLSAHESSRLLAQLDDWDLVENHHLRKHFFFKDFAGALAFVNEIGSLAEQQGHHPDIYLSWGKVTVSLYTHKINGLHENDFILAAKIDGLRPVAAQTG